MHRVVRVLEQVGAFLARQPVRFVLLGCHGVLRSRARKSVAGFGLRGSEIMDTRLSLLAALGVAGQQSGRAAEPYRQRNLQRPDSRPPPPPGQATRAFSNSRVAGISAVFRASSGQGFGNAPPIVAQVVLDKGKAKFQNLTCRK